MHLRTTWKGSLNVSLLGVVAKRLDSLYRPGRREGAWIKIKPSGSKSLANFGGYPGKDR